MSMVRYGISRHVPAVDANGKDTTICLCLIQHENGFMQRHAIPEELIRFAGEGVIDLEVKEAAAKGGIEYVEKPR